MTVMLSHAMKFLSLKMIFSKMVSF